MEHNHHEHQHSTGSHAHAAHGASAHDKHAGHHTGDFWKRFVICSIVSVPLLVLSHMIQTWLGFALAFPGDKFVLALLSAFVFFYGGYPFLKGLYDEVKDQAIGMMTLIGVAITVAWAYSLAVTFG